MEVEVNEKELIRSTEAAAAEEEIRNSCDGSAGDRSLTEEPRRQPSAEASGDDGKEENDGKKRKRCRRKRKAGEHHHHQRVHRWKPYVEMTWEEKQELEELEALRANRKRDKRFASGQPMAPYNTTQFLMEQHDGDDRTPRGVEPNPDEKIVFEPPFKQRHPSGLGDRSGSGEDDSLSDSPSWHNDFEDSYLQRDFIKAYESFRAERLQAMTKDELIRECLIMEGKLEQLKEDNDRLTKDVAHLQRTNAPRTTDVSKKWV